MDAKNADNTTTYLWSTGAVTQTITSLDVTTTYIVTVYNECMEWGSDSKTVTLESCDITIPDIITPNADGSNDNLFIQNVDYLDWEVTIYNRWGNKIWETNAYRNNVSGKCWDGKGVTDGVYFYVAKNAEKNLSHTGYIHVVRD